MECLHVGDKGEGTPLKRGDLHMLGLDTFVITAAIVEGAGFLRPDLIGEVIVVSDGAVFHGEEKLVALLRLEIQADTTTGSFMQIEGAPRQTILHGGKITGRIDAHILRLQQLIDAVAVQTIETHTSHAQALTGGATAAGGELVVVNHIARLGDAVEKEANADGLDQLELLL